MEARISPESRFDAFRLKRYPIPSSPIKSYPTRSNPQPSPAQPTLLQANNSPHRLGQKQQVVRQNMENHLIILDPGKASHRDPTATCNTVKFERRTSVTLQRQMSSQWKKRKEERERQTIPRQRGGKGDRWCASVYPEQDSCSQLGPG